MRSHVLFLAALLLQGACAAGPEEPFPVVDGEREAVIVGNAVVAGLPFQGPKNFLQHYVEQSTGRRLRVVAESDYDPVTMPYAIFVGDSAKARELFGSRLKSMGVDDYLVHVSSNLVVLCGATPETRNWAQFDFAREYLGVDCYFPHDLGLVVPKHDKVLVPVGTRFERPVFKNRGLYGFNAAGKRASGWSAAAIPWRTPMEQRGPVGSHTIQKLITVKEYGEAHPEYFPLIDGRRKVVDSGSGPGPCVSNPEVVAIVIEKIRKYFDANPGEKFFSLGMTDGGYCGCEACQALDGPPLKIEGCRLGYPVARRWFGFLNQVAAAVRQSHPGRVITTLGYAGCQLPPADLDLEPNIMPFLCWSHSCWFDPEVRRVNLAVTDAWLERLDQIGIYEYFYGASLAIPMIYSHDMADYLRHAARTARNKEALGIFVEANASWGMDGPKLWVLEKLMWNPEQDVDALTRRWCDGLFEEAAPAMLRYFGELEQARVRNGAKLQGLTEYVPWKGRAETLDLQVIFGLWQKSCQLLLFPPADVARCQAILEEARQAATQEIVKARIDYFASTFKLTEHASRTYHAYAALGGRFMAGAEPRELLTALIEGDALAPDVDALEYAQALMVQDATKFHGPAIHLAGCGLAVRDIVVKTAGAAIDAALAAGERNRDRLVDAGVAALMEAAPSQDLAVTAVGERRLDMLRSVAARVATACHVATPPTIDGNPGEALWKWVDQRPWFKWQSAMPDTNASNATHFAFAYDERYLYVALRCPQADLAAQQRCPARYGANAFQYPSVELFINADQPGSATNRTSFYQAIPAYGGGFMEAGGGTIGDKPAATEAYAMSEGTNEWRAELKIDLAKLGWSPAANPWLRINLVRNLGAGGFSGRSWFPSPAAHRESASRGWLVFEDRLSLLRNGDFSDWPAGSAFPRGWTPWDRACTAGTVSNEAGAVCFRNASPDLQIRQQVRVTPGVAYELACVKKVQVGGYFLLTAVSFRDADGKPAGYSMALDAGYDTEFQTMRNVFIAPSNAVTVEVIVGPYCINRKGAVVGGTLCVKEVFFAPASTAAGEADPAMAPLTAGERAVAATLLADDRHPAFAGLRERLADAEADPAALRRDLHLARMLPPGDAPPLFAVGAGTENDKFYPDTLYEGSLDAPLRLALAGNEAGSFQLAVFPFWTDLKDATVSFSSLRGPGGAEIAAAYLRWFREGYLTQEQPRAWLGLRYKHPRVPDPLLPAAPFDVAAGSLAALWVDVLAPAGTPAGLYTGTVTVTANGRSVERRLEVEAHGFDIPKVSSIANEFWFCPENWNAFYGAGFKYTPELHARHAAVLGRYRVSSFPCDWKTLCPQVTIHAEPDGRFTFDWTTFDRYVQNALDNGSTAFWSGLSCNSGWTRYLHSPRTKVIERSTGKTVELARYLPPMPAGWVTLDKMPYRENRVYRDFLRAYTAHLQELGIADRAYYELFDEPGGERFVEMTRHHRFLREVAPDLRLTSLNPDPTWEFNGTNAIGLLDMWGPGIGRLDSTNVLAAMQARRVEHGEKLWFYACIETRRNPDGSISHTSRVTEDQYSPYCTYYRPYLAVRIIPWMAWKYGIDGFFVFAMNQVPKANTGKTAETRWPASEWFDGRERGCGTLVYPGPDHELIPGMRLANLRDGLEDYEYFATLKARAARLDPAAHADLIRRVEDALRMDADIIGSVYDWTKDRERLEAKRRQLVQLIREVDR